MTSGLHTAADPAFGTPPLKAVFAGAHAWCGEKLRPAAELEDALPLEDFLSGDGFAEVIARFAAARGDADRRVAASFWSLYYFSALAIPFIVAARAGIAVPVSMRDMTISLDPEGLPSAFGLSGDCDWREETGAVEIVGALVEAHLARAVSIMRARAGISEKLLWNNAAVYIDHAISATDPDPAMEAGAWAAESLFNCPHFANGNRNPFLGCLRQEREGGTIYCRRKLCCLRYRLPGIAGCGELCALPELRKS
jgi:ferric iron reductase protein FhuF